MNIVHEQKKHSGPKYYAAILRVLIAVYVLIAMHKNTLLAFFSCSILEVFFFKIKTTILQQISLLFNTLILVMQTQFQRCYSKDTFQAIYTGFGFVLNQCFAVVFFIVGFFLHPRVYQNLNKYSFYLEKSCILKFDRRFVTKYMTNKIHL
jgi:hypothetical protein